MKIVIIPRGQRLLLTRIFFELSCDSMDPFIARICDYDSFLHLLIPSVCDILWSTSDLLGCILGSLFVNLFGFILGISVFMVMGAPAGYLHGGSIVMVVGTSVGYLPINSILTFLVLSILNYFVTWF